MAGPAEQGGRRPQGIRRVVGTVLSGPESAARPPGGAPIRSRARRPAGPASGGSKGQAVRPAAGSGSGRGDDGMKRPSIRQRQKEGTGTALVGTSSLRV